MNNSKTNQDTKIRACTGRCLPGYHFEEEEEADEITLECRGGTWRPRRYFPPCKSDGYCNLRIVGAGFFNCTTGMDGTLCDVTCDYRFQGRYHCYPGRNWNPPLPYCAVPKETDSGRTPCRCENGGVCDVRGRCDCPARTTGEFCEHLEKEKATCPDPGIPRGGSRMNSDGTDASYPRVFEEGESVIYSCNEDNLALQGTSFVTCRADGTWSAPRPRCIRSRVDPLAYCPDPGQITYGSRRNADGSSTRSSRIFSNGQSVIYSCNTGYELVGDSVLTCMQTGRWSKSRPSCRRTRRVPVNEPKDGEKLCNNPGVNENTILTKPIMDSLRVQEFPPGTQLKYECTKGYEPEGPSIIFCLRSGEWTSPPPTCRRIITTVKPTEPPSCRHPGVDVNGEIEDHPLLDPRKRGQTFPPGTELKFRCQDGYEAVGPIILQCMRSGEWTSAPPTCRLIPTTTVASTPCRHPGMDVNGVIEDHPLLDLRRRGQTFPSGTELRFGCREGYEVVGPSILYCYRYGEWSSAPPTCRLIPTTTAESRMQCPYPRVDPNGEIEDIPLIDPRRRGGQGFVVGSAVTFTCKENYVMVGSNSITCLRTGRWSSAAPRCDVVSRTSTNNRITCPNPSVDPNGEIEDIPLIDPRRRGQGFEVGSTVTFTCKEDYELVGSNSITCLRTGRWSNDSPRCNVIPRASNPDPSNVISCENPGPISNGRVIVFRTLDENRPPPVVEDDFEYPVRTRLQYSCEEGYLLRGESNLVCEATSFWSAEIPMCIEDCGRSLLQTTRRISHGTRTVVGEWPWTVAIALNRNNYSTIICGGALLDRRTIITAAHCFERDDAQYYTVYFGKYHRRDRLDDRLVKFSLTSRIVSHPEFDGITFNNDIALVKFAPSVQYSVRIQPICLPTPRSSARNLVPPQRGYVTGWGINENGVVSEELLMAYLPVQTDQTCTEAYQRQGLNLTIRPGMFCAGFPQGVISACTGDSGSPLVFYNNNTDRHILEGLVSYAVNGNCGLPDRYTVFTRVAYYMPWILRNWPR
ncbi:hypothetical protein CDAR_376481 [Caerostris darwini]|uniref:Limulus clotting factor C n=1 Tax=Caerostris darwini TaxID=1538125 RepID=A0AAV4SQV6_9ARAC|nr:hypothetical protein CDAR_376481 [Caerostris darwini]